APTLVANGRRRDVEHGVPNAGLWQQEKAVVGDAARPFLNVRNGDGPGARDGDEWRLHDRFEVKEPVAAVIHAARRDNERAARREAVFAVQGLLTIDDVEIIADGLRN